MWPCMRLYQHSENTAEVLLWYVSKMHEMSYQLSSSLWGSFVQNIFGYIRVGVGRITGSLHVQQVTLAFSWRQHWVPCVIRRNLETSPMRPFWRWPFFVVCFFSLFFFVLLLLLLFAFPIAEAASPASATYLSFVLFCFFCLILLIVVLSNKATTMRKNWRWFEPFSDIPLWKLYFRVNEGLRGFSSVADLSWAEVIFQGEMFTTFIDIVGFRIPLKDDATRPFGLS